MNAFSSETSRLKITLNILVLGFSIYGMTQSEINARRSSAIEKAIINLVAPVQKGVFNSIDAIQSFWEHYISLVDIAHKNTYLTQEIERLEGRILSLHEVQRENIRLKDLLKFGKEIVSEKVLAQIVGRDSTGQFRVLRINKGAKDGITLKATVVTSGGVIGYINRLTDYYADILTILDPNNRIDGIVSRTRTHGIVQGLNMDKCQMKYVKRTEPILIGDTILTSGLGSIYPKGLKIGHVTKIERESYGITQTIEVTPSVNFHKLEEVVVLLGPGKRD